ncbi:alpha-L-fucosidase [Croceivirga sp. JEA036]|uniref:alpha-L-fucosidase n=1 Tax=Croceivirga sp. JEA036 TaxID=2721162 RepID=UPI00143B5A07|nr:alpha-L-fucosidase [Croceivirga sp. JEA036]NJB35186.1 alpha-L-fucosidase [Croceivirga sp. JEA036]
MKTSTALFGTLLVFSMACKEAKEPPKESSGEKKVEAYAEEWASLGSHQEAPEWFKDAKLGIYFHWGLYSVPAYGNEWYPRWMHFKDHNIYQHHVEKYGDPAEFGYHDFAPLFTAEHFNAEEWAQLFKAAGAKFAGPVAEHHDGFAMWDSEITPWNVMDKEPKKDITGLLEKAIRAEGMKLITAFHHAKNLQRSTTLGVEDEKSHFPYFENMPPSSDDPELQLLYGNMEPEQWYKDIWTGKLKEVIDNYRPDIIWFDYVLGDIPEAYRKEFAAYYLNKAKENNQEVVIVRKQHDMPLNMSVEDLEQARKNEIGTKTWMTDATISNGSWGYTENLGVKAAEDVLHMLIDITSKNGVLLLNVSPKADGTIPQNQKEALLKMGAWLQTYGDAIYGTEAWYTFGEGPTKEPEGHFKNHHAFMKLKYSNKDIRYTTKDYHINAIVLGALEPNSKLTLEAFAKEQIKDEVSITKVQILGSDAKVNWELTDEGLVVETPSTSPETMANIVQVTIEQ